MKDLEHDLKHAVVNERKLTREIIAKGVKSDLNMVFTLVHGMLTKQELFDAIVDVYWNEYQAAQAQMELPIPPADEQSR